MDKDYSHLADRAIKWVMGSGKVYVGKVVYVDRAIGITIVDKANPKCKLTCINGPSSPNSREHKQISHIYDDLFLGAVNMIEEGRYDSRLQLVIAHGEGYSNGAAVAECAYGA